MTDNLLAMQRSAKAIRNPFGFDFTCKWNGEPVVIPGDGNQYTFVGPLARHIIKHLKMAVLYRYHDEQVAKFKAAGKLEEARKYRNSEALVNKVHMMITGETDPTLNASREEIEKVDLDLDILRKEMSTVEAKAANSSIAHDISSVIDSANIEAAKEAEGLGEGQTASLSGQAPIGEVAPEEPSLPTKPLEAQPVQEQPVAPQQPAPEEPSAEAIEEFPGLQEL